VSTNNLYSYVEWFNLIATIQNNATLPIAHLRCSATRSYWISPEKVK